MPAHMPVLKFSRRAIDNIPTPESGRVQYRDQVTPYLVLRVTSTGHKTYQYCRCIKGRTVRATIGPFPAVSVDVARREAHKMSDRVAQGLPLRPEKVNVRTFAWLFDSYMENHAKPNKRTWKEDQRKYDKHLSEWADLDIMEIEPIQVNRKINEIAETSTASANRLLSLICKVFNYAIKDLDIDMRNPTRRSKKRTEEARRRYLDLSEIKRFRNAMDTLVDEWENPPKDSPRRAPNARSWHFWRDYFTILLLTGARRTMVRKMRWDDIRLGDGLWLLSGSQVKSKKASTVLLPTDAIAILERRHTARKGPYVFPSRKNPNEPVNEVWRAWRIIVERAGLVDCKIHDLRKTFGTRQLQMGASIETVSESLGHADINVTQDAYAFVNVKAVRESVERAAKSMMGEGQDASN